MAQALKAVDVATTSPVEGIAVTDAGASKRYPTQALTSGTGAGTEPSQLQAEDRDSGNTTGRTTLELPIHVLFTSYLAL